MKAKTMKAERPAASRLTERSLAHLRNASLTEKLKKKYRGSRLKPLLFVVGWALAHQSFKSKAKMEKPSGL
ncbi:hypothetical protein ACVBIL_17920, partial [Shewanella sp. 125m-7]